MSAPLVLRQGCQERRAAWDPLTGASPGLCSGGSLVRGGGGGQHLGLGAPRTEHREREAQKSALPVSDSGKSSQMRMEPKTARAAGGSMPAPWLRGKSSRQR